MEVEAGLTWDPHDSIDTPISLKAGTGEATELFVSGSPLLVLEAPGEDSVGTGDVVVGVRHRPIDEGDGRPSFAVQPSIKLPTADEDEGLGSGELDASLAAILTKSVGCSTWTAFYQFDLLGEPEGGTSVGHGFALAASRPLTEELGAFVEVASVLVPEQDADSTFTTAGLTYAVSEYLVLDAGVLMGLSNGPEPALLVGFTRSIGAAGGGR